MVNQQKQVQQETAYSAAAYSAVVVNVSPSLPISLFHGFDDTFGSKTIHMIIHHNCIIGSFLFHSFLQIIYCNSKVCTY